VRDEVGRAFVRAVLVSMVAMALAQFCNVYGG
jgi:hypothetical protein